MPTYDYRCESCGNAFEEFQSITAETLKKCPKCGKNKLVRLIGTGAGVIFKGSGFYETDYRSESYKKSAEAEKGGSKTETKTDAAPAPTAVASGDGAAKTETAPKSAADAPAPAATTDKTPKASKNRAAK